MNGTCGSLIHSIICNVVQLERIRKKETKKGQLACNFVAVETLINARK